MLLIEKKKNMEASARQQKALVTNTAMVCRRCHCKIVLCAMQWAEYAQVLKGDHTSVVE